jgi:hypothetical protein
MLLAAFFCLYDAYYASFLGSPAFFFGAAFLVAGFLAAGALRTSSFLTVCSK